MYELYVFFVLVSLAIVLVACYNICLNHTGDVE